jgi:alkylated DNA repair protein alkB family protein 8
VVLEDVVSREEELELLERIDQGQWERLNNRRVQHHGYAFKYGRNQIDKAEQEGLIPPFFNKLLQRLSHIEMLKGCAFDQLTINDYFAGNGIPSHFDTHSPFEEIFLSVSLLSGIVMDFRKYNGEERSVYLK